MACEQKARLTAAYEAAAKRFSAAVTELQRKMGTSPRAAYQRLMLASEDARTQAERARIALEEHIGKHDC
jgi:hypothetical protein